MTDIALPLMDYPALLADTFTAFCGIVIALAVVIGCADAVSTWRERRYIDRQRSIAQGRIGDTRPCALCGNVRVWDGRTVAFVQCDRSEVAKPVCASCAAATHQLGRVA